MNRTDFFASAEAVIRETIATVSTVYGKSGSHIDISSPSYRRPILERIWRVLYANAWRPDVGKLTVLDIGVGKGWSSYLLAAHCRRVLACDLSTTISEQMELNDQPQWQRLLWKHFVAGRPNLAYVFFDGTALPVTTESVDLAVAVAVFEHVGNNTLDHTARRAWLREVSRVLKPGGRLLIVACPNRHSYAEALARLLGLPHHTKTFSGNEMRMLIEEAGLAIEEIQFTHPFIDFYPLRLMQRLWSVCYGCGIRFVEPVLGVLPLRYVWHHHCVIAVRK